VTALALLVIAALAGTVVALLIRPVRLHPRHPAQGNRRILVPFTGGALDTRVLEAAIRVSLAEHATLVPAYLMVVPLRLPQDAPMADEVARAVPLLDAVENRATRAGVAVESRIEKGRTPTHALRQIWAAEQFDRVIAPAPGGHGEGFTPKEMTWILTHAPVETIVLRPTPEPDPDPEPVRSAVRAVAHAIAP
jgi:hypothetical protein